MSHYTKQSWPWKDTVPAEMYAHRNDWPKISIVTPSFNQGQYIEETILSVIGQNYPNLEYIVIDGGSTDNTVEILKKYEHQLTYWVSEPDKGQSHAINKGLERCTGHVFNWLNSDDYYMPNTFFHLAEAYFKNPNISCWAGGFRQFFDGQPNSNEDFEPMTISSPPSRTMGTPIMLQPSTFFSLSVLREIGGINDKLRYVMDLEMWIRYLIQKGDTELVRIAPMLTAFRRHVQSKTVNESVRFVAETDKLYFSIAILIKAVAQKETLNHLYNNELKDLVFSWGLSEQQRLRLRESLSYYLLERAHQLYAANQWKNARILLKATETQLMDKPAQKMYKRLYLRTRLPSWIAKIRSKK
jgi:glycosyltransferase involved in cell wall biosynthesis